MKNIKQMTRAEFEALPFRESWHTPVICTSFVIIPGRSSPLHDSGYRHIDIVACEKMDPICRCAGFSDVLWFDKMPTTPRVDCLPASGLIHMFLAEGRFRIGEALSSLDIRVIA